MPPVIAAEDPEPDDPLRKLASHFRVEFTLTLSMPSGAAIAILPADVAKRFHIAPIRLEGSEDSATLILATSAPGDLDVFDTLSVLLGCELEFIAAPASEVSRVIQHAYPQNA